MKNTELLVIATLFCATVGTIYTMYAANTNFMEGYVFGVLSVLISLGMFICTFILSVQEMTK